MATKAPKSAPSAATQTAQEPVLQPANTQVPATTSNASGALALPAELAAELAAEAQDAAAQERPSVSKISLKSGVIAYMGAAVPGNALEGILLVGAKWNRYYAGKYDPNNIVNPTCFAIAGVEADEMAPHENVSEPVNPTCKGCPNLEWGSNPNSPSGRGKACSESRRLVFLPKDALASVDAINKAEMAVIDLPVTSVREYANYINSLSVSVKRPMWAVVTRVSLTPDMKTQFKVNFTPIQLVDDADLLRALKARQVEGLRAATIPYDESYLQGETDDKNAQNVAPPSGRGSAKFAR